MTAFWGEDDVVLQGFDSSGDLGRELQARGVRVTPMPGLGHHDVLLHLDDVLGHVSTWLAATRDEFPSCGSSILQLDRRSVGDEREAE